MTLSEPQKKHLRGLGHQLKPLIMIGEAGLTDSLLLEFDSTLAHHELIKIRVRSGDRQTRDAIVSELCKRNDAALIQRIGNIALLYRPNPEKPPEKRLRLPNR